MDAALFEHSAVLSKSTERSSYWFTLFIVYVLLFANTFFPVFAVTAIALIYIIIYLLLSKLRVPKDIWRYCSIPVVLAVIGFSGCFGHDLYDVMKDAWYIVNSALVLLAGYLVMKRVGDIERLLRVLVIAGFIVALYHLGDIASDPTFLFSDSATVGAFRQEVGNGYLLTCISLLIMMFSNRFGIELFTSRHKKVFVSIMILVTAASTILSLSRTMWGFFIIVAFVMLGQFTLKRARIFFYVALILTVLMTLQTFNSGGQAEHNTMLGKIVDSVDEVMLRDYTKASDIHLHWRGYESYMAMQTYLSGGWWNLVFGHGFGKLVDLKIKMLLGGNEFRFVPILHNGFMYILVKTGAAGTALYLMYLFLFYKHGSVIASSKESKDVFVGRMIIAISLVLGFTTFVFLGYFHKSTMVSTMFLLGLLLCYARERKINGAGLRRPLER